MKPQSREKRLDSALKRIAAILLIHHSDSPKTQELLDIIGEAFKYDHPEEIRIDDSAKRPALSMFQEYTGMSLAEIGRYAGLSRSMLSKYAAGKRELSLAALQRLSDAMKMIVRRPDIKLRLKLFSSISPMIH